MGAPECLTDCLEPCIVTGTGLLSSILRENGKTHPIKETIREQMRLLEQVGTRSSSLHVWLDGLRPLLIGEYTALHERWSCAKSRMLSFWEEYDALICPVNAHPAIPHGTTTEGAGFADYSYTMTENLTGCPSAVVRCGSSDEGLPIGIQIVAAPWHDDVSLAVAQHLQDTMRY